jgi:hypothetical protein
MSITMFIIYLAIHAHVNDLYAGESETTILTMNEQNLE